MVQTQKLEARIRLIAEAAKEASRQMANASTGQKNRVLKEMATGLRRSKAAILKANAKDMAHAAKAGLSKAMLDRLMLDDARVEAMASAVLKLVSLPDPVGKRLESRTLKNGLKLEKVRCPLGVVGIVYESRPNVTIDAAALCLKAGNAVILRGGSEALNSNLALGELLRAAVIKAGLPKEAVSVIPVAGRAAVRALLKQDQSIDVIIPRGGRGLIDAVVRLSKIPVIRHDIGNCHVYVDKDADLEMAKRIALNAKISRPGVCNAMEHLLVNARVADRFLPGMVRAFQEHGVIVRGDKPTRASAPGVQAANERDWYAEYLDLVVGVKVVKDLDDAIRHINHYGSGHSDAIVTGNAKAGGRFQREVDSAAVYINASTRFTDGGEFGLGAEIGISTQKLHARGPMALEELCSAKWLVTGRGQVRG